MLEERLQDDDRPSTGNPDGTRIGKLRMPEVCSNFTFGGARRNELFITASSSVYTLRVNFNGARYP
jgi:gluconolactonase